MDPFSHALLGASCGQARARREQLVAAGGVALVAAIAPDLDALIQSSSDPLLVLEYHRQFTHSLPFAPIGALLCAAACWWFVRSRLSFRHAYVLALLGYTSHLLLDACTTYGTQLLWPFADTRFAWNFIAVIDPLFTLPVLVLVIAALLARRVGLARAAIAWAVAYVALGALQHSRATAAAMELAASRGHQPETLVVTPALFSLVLWKTVYEHAGTFHVDAVRAGFVTSTLPGETIAKLDAARDFPWLAPTSQQAIDVERFARVAHGLVAVDETAADRVIDLRYSLVPNEIAGFWAIVLNPEAGPSEHVDYVVTREQAPEQARRLLAMLF
ncbi:MAG TPA: metal-dependent hydrolase [Gammaproteobacteria bacterium]|nr:metal-dependent hydrolase [Gammaproteobacteria bacterium]